MGQDKNMNTDRKSSTSVSVKQGYLHIKRERSSYPVASKVLFKPWQQAYFILRRDPFVMEEYKDATLKTPKQHHFVGTIKHVGLVRTSKSQQFAFEVVVKEDTALLFGCENHILREEWISAFVEVMNAASEMRRKHTPSGQGQHKKVERQGSLNDTYRVLIVDTSLSRSNELCGEYFISLTPARMSLLGKTDLNEILSWPINNVTYYTHQPHTNQVILIMSRMCHFGCGKLIFESKQCEQLLRCIEAYHTRNRTSVDGLRSRSQASSSFTSTNSSVGSNSLSDRSPLAISCDDEPVFEICQSTDHEANELENVIKKTDATPSFINHDLNFPEITNEEGYILPNEPDISLKLNGENKHVRLSSRESTSRSTNSSDNENEVSSSYLQIVDNEETTDDPEAKKMLEAINTSLTNPLNNPSTCLSSMNSFKMLNQGSNSPKLSHNTKFESRRASEPPKTFTRSEKDQLRFANSGKKLSSLSMDSANADAQSKSPLVNRIIKTNAFPKKHSISHGNHDSVHIKADKISGNPFDKLESFFMSHPSPRFQVPLSQSLNGLSLLKHNMGMRRNLTESMLSTAIPELDRNTKPKSMGKTLDIPKVTPEVTIEHHASDDNSGSPPPIPERVSPKLFESPLKKKLQRTQEIEVYECESSSDMNSSNESVESCKVDIEPKNKLGAPPLPPKAKLLSSTKSAPIPGRESPLEKESESNSTNALLRTSSLGIRPANTLQLDTDSECTCDQGKSDQEEDDMPPAIPCRLPVHPLAKRQHLSTSEGNLLRNGLRNPRKIFKETNNNTISQSFEALTEKNKFSKGFRRITVHEIDNQAPICDDGILSICPVVKPNGRTIQSFYPKPTKKVF